MDQLFSIGNYNQAIVTVSGDAEKSRSALAPPIYLTIWNEGENDMATVEELQVQVNALEVRLAALERSLFGERHGALETRATRTVPTPTSTK